MLQLVWIPDHVREDTTFTIQLARIVLISGIVLV